MVELSVVVRAVAGSNPVAHPIFSASATGRRANVVILRLSKDRALKELISPPVDKFIKIAEACNLSPQELLPEDYL